MNAKILRLFAVPVVLLAAFLMASASNWVSAQPPASAPADAAPDVQAPPSPGEELPPPQDMADRQGPPAPDAGRILKDFDKNGDGALSQEEIQAALEQFAPPQDGPRRGYDRGRRRDFGGPGQDFERGPGRGFGGPGPDFDRGPGRGFGGPGPDFDRGPGRGFGGPGPDFDRGPGRGFGGPREGFGPGNDRMGPPPCMQGPDMKLGAGPGYGQGPEGMRGAGPRDGRGPGMGPRPMRGQGPEGAFGQDAFRHMGPPQDGDRPGPPRGGADARFKAMDTNGDGVLSNDEFQAYHSRLRRPVPSEDAGGPAEPPR